MSASPVTHVAKYPLGAFATTVAECGRRARVGAFAVTVDATCPECRAAVDRFRESTRALLTQPEISGSDAARELGDYLTASEATKYRSRVLSIARLRSGA